MEHFLEGIAPLRHWYINPNEKGNKYKSSLLSQLTKALTEHFLQGNVPLGNLLHKCKTSAFVLTEICLQRCKRLDPKYVFKISNYVTLNYRGKNKYNSWFYSKFVIFILINAKINSISIRNNKSLLFFIRMDVTNVYLQDSSLRK